MHCWTTTGLDTQIKQENNLRNSGNNHKGKCWPDISKTEQLGIHKEKQLHAAYYRLEVLQEVFDSWEIKAACLSSCHLVCWLLFHLQQKKTQPLQKIKSTFHDASGGDSDQSATHSCIWHLQKGLIKDPFPRPEVYWANGARHVFHTPIGIQRVMKPMLCRSSLLPKTFPGTYFRLDFKNPAWWGI